MITAKDIELRAGARLLLEAATFQIAPGDRIGLVGRNGAGKTTLARVLAGEGQPAGGTVRRSGTVGYLPQDPRTGDLNVLAMDRVLSSRGLDELLGALRKAEEQMAATDPGKRDAAVRRYGHLEERLTVLGGYAAQAEASSLAASLGLPGRVLGQPLHTLSGGQRRRVELARILFGGAQTLLLDEPTNHLDADSVGWLRDHLKAYRGGLVVISHDVALLADVVNKVFYLDAQRCVIDQYNLGWKAYLTQRETDAARRKRERMTNERKAAALQAQAAKLGAKATKATAAKVMARRAEKLLRNMSVVAEIQSAIALIRKHRNSNKTAVQQFIGQQADATVTQPATGNTSHFTRYAPGTILDAPGGIEYDFPAAGLDAAMVHCGRVDEMQLEKGWSLENIAALMALRGEN